MQCSSGFSARGGGGQLPPLTPSGYATDNELLFDVVVTDFYGCVTCCFYFHSFYSEAKIALSAKHRIGTVCFSSKTGFWPLYCQISTDLDKILHTPIVIRNTLVVRLRLRSARERLQARPERLCFYAPTPAGHKSDDAI